MWQIGGIQVPTGSASGVWTGGFSPAVPQGPVVPSIQGGGSLVEIDFARGGNAASFLRNGWGEVEDRMIWGTGARSGLRVPIQHSGGTMVLEAEIVPGLEAPEITAQVLRVHVNGILAGTSVLTAAGSILMEIDRRLAGDDGMLNIEFEFPGFFRPGVSRPRGDAVTRSAAFTRLRVYNGQGLETGLRCPPGPPRRAAPDQEVLHLSPPATDPVAPDAPLSRETYTFGSEGNGRPLLKDGWRESGPGSAHGSAPCCALEIPAPSGSGGKWRRGHVLRLEVAPGGPGPREITAVCAGVVAGQFSLTRPEILILPLPAELLEGRAMLPLRFILPDAAPRTSAGSSGAPGLVLNRIDVITLPADLSAWASVRTDQGLPPSPVELSPFQAVPEEALPKAVEAALGLHPAALMARFESLGSGCEFALAQKKWGVDALNLFRFCHGDGTALIRALADDIAAAADPGRLTLELNQAEPPEYMACLRLYGLRWHTFAHLGDAAPRKLWHAEAVNFAYLRRKFLDGARSGRKIHVLRQAPGVSSQHAIAVLLELRRHGPANLLWVEDCPDGRRPGDLELVAPGLMRGYMPASGQETDIGAIDTAGWLRLAANAEQARRGQTGTR